jgi:copper chaperone CopZ
MISRLTGGAMDKPLETIRGTIEIIGMTCTGCARTLEMRKFKGIEYSVNFPERSLTVAFSPAKYKREDFEKAIESHGYKIKGKVINHTV